MILELSYHASGILAGIFLVSIAVLLFKKNKDIIRTNIFLKYGRFRTAFLTIAIGSVLFIIGNLSELAGYPKLDELHETGEIAYNISMLIFAFLIFKIIRRKNA